MNNKKWENSICEVCYKLIYNKNIDHKLNYLYTSILENVPRITFEQCEECDINIFRIKIENKIFIIQSIEILELNRIWQKELSFNVIYIYNNDKGISYYKKKDNIYIFKTYSINKTMMYISPNYRYIFFENMDERFKKRDLIDFHHDKYIELLFKTGLNLEILESKK